MELKHIGRYDIKSLIGQGGMSAVYLGYDPRALREVAIKILPPYFSHADKFRERFEREALTIALLEHPAIVPVYDMGEEDGQPYIVMRYMSGGSLAEKLKRGPIFLREASDMYTRLAPALDTAHARGVTHRDVKPDNLLFDKYGNVFLSDFGLARLRETIGFANISDGSIMGTPAYMSPEQIQGDREIDGRSDIYSMGVVLYHMLSGSVPFNGTTAASVMMMHLINPVPQICEQNQSLPVGIQAVLDIAMAKNPDDRYQTAGDFAKAIQAVTTGVYKKLSLSTGDDTPLPRSHKRPTLVYPPEAPVIPVNGSLAGSVTPANLEAISEDDTASETPEAEVPLQAAQAPVPFFRKLASLLTGNRSIPLWGWVLSVSMIIVLSILFVQGLRGGFPFSLLKASNLTPSSTLSQSNPQAGGSLPSLSLGKADKLAFVNASEIWVSNLDGSSLTQLTSDAEKKTNLNWSPDGQSVIFTSGNCLKMVNLQSKQVRSLTCISGITVINALDISSDGQSLALGLENTELYLLPYAQLSALRTTSLPLDLATLAQCPYYAPYRPAQAFKSVTWSLDDNRLAMLFSRLVDGVNRDVVSILDFKQCNPSPSVVKEISPTYFLFTMPGYYDHPELSGLSWNTQDQLLLNGIMNNEGFGDLQVYNLDQDQGQALSPNGTCCYRDAHWSPDGTYLLYSFQSESGGEISLFYTPTSQLEGTAGPVASLALPAGFFADNPESLQPALRAVH